MWADKAAGERPDWIPALRTASACYALAGGHEDAKRAMARLHQLAPEIRISGLKDLMPLRRSDDLLKFTEALRLAGLPA